MSALFIFVAAILNGVSNLFGFYCFKMLAGSGILIPIFESGKGAVTAASFGKFPALLYIMFDEECALSASWLVIHFVHLLNYIFKYMYTKNII